MPSCAVYSCQILPNKGSSKYTHNFLIVLYDIKKNSGQRELPISLQPILRNFTGMAHVVWSRGEPFGDEFFDNVGYVTPTITTQAMQEQQQLKVEVAQEVAVKDTDITRRGKFSRVLGVDYDTGRVFFPVAMDLPKKDSPSYRLTENPLQLKEAIRATIRMNVLDKGDIYYGSGFALSPNIVLTCGHVATEAGAYRCMHGGMVQNELFSFSEKPRYHLKMLDGHKRWDYAMLRTSLSDSGFQFPKNPRLRSRFRYFLLPCSPEDANVFGVCIVSFPTTTNFLLRAEEELVDGVIRGGSSIWDVYKPAMSEELEDIHLRHPNKSESQVDDIVKRILFKKLLETFLSQSGGSMTAAFGFSSIVDENNVLTTCSTLYGSSGGPICPIDHPGYFSGWHIGAAPDYLHNEAITCDNLDFVASYFQHVLGDLPEPRDRIWHNWKLDLFFMWILKHEKKLVQIGYNGKQWIKAAHASLNSSRKRRRGM